MVRLRGVLLMILAFAAGAADVVAYLGLQRIFVANMTGNIVLFGLNAAAGSPFGALLGGVATVAFALGLLAGFLVAGRPDPGRIWPPRVTVALAAELGLHLLFLAMWWTSGADPGGPGMIVMVAVPAAAMGVQAAAVQRLSAAGITATFVTGTLAAVMGALAVGDRRAALLRTGVIVSLAVGAATAGLLFNAMPVVAGAIAPIAVAVVVAVSYPVVVRGRRGRGSER